MNTDDSDGDDDVSRLGDFDLQWFVVVALVVALIIGALWAGRADGAEPTFTVVNKVPPTFTVVNKVPAETTPTPAAGRGVAARAVGAVTPPVIYSWPAYNPPAHQPAWQVPAYPFGPGTTAPCAGGFNTGSPARGRWRVLTGTFVPRVTPGGTASAGCVT